MDVLTPEQRSRNMAAIRNKNTKPEIVVRKLVHAMGFRYRLHQAKLPGKPDLVFSSKRKVIFVHGCFWHLHDCRYGQVKPATREQFWSAKRQGNADRDRRNKEALQRDGWDVLEIWECEASRPEQLETIRKRVQSFLKKKTPA